MSDFDIAQFILSMTNERLPFLVNLARDFVNTNPVYCRLAKSQRNLFLQVTIEKENFEDLMDWIKKQAQREVTGKWGFIKKNLNDTFKKIENKWNEIRLFEWVEDKFGRTVLSQVRYALTTNNNLKRKFTHLMRIQFVSICNELCDIFQESNVFNKDVIKNLRSALNV